MSVINTKNEIFKNLFSVTCSGTDEGVYLVSLHHHKKDKNQENTTCIIIIFTIVGC